MGVGRWGSVGRGVRWLNLRRIRRQPLRAALAIVAVAAGVSLSMAVVIDAASVHRSLGRFGSRLAGPAQLRIVGASSRGGLDPAVAGTATKVDGVMAAVPLVEAVTIAEASPSHQLSIVALGVDCSVEALAGPIGCDQRLVRSASGTSPFLISSRLLRELGPEGVVRTDLGRIPVRQASPIEALDSVNGGRIAVFALPAAQRLFGRQEGIDGAYIVARSGTDIAALRRRLQAAVGPQNGVLTATDPQPGPDPSGPLLPLLSVFSLLALGIGALLVYNIVSLSLAERRRELAVVSALGGTARLVVTGAVVEAAALGLVGGLIGLAAAIPVGATLVASVSMFTERFAGLHISTTVPGALAVEGPLLGMAVAAVAAIAPARRACRRDVSAELQGRAQLGDAAPRVSVRRTLIAGAVGAGGVSAAALAAHGGGLRPWQPGVASVGLIAAVGGSLSAAGSATPVVVAGLRRLLGTRAGMIGVAAANLVSEGRRTAVMATAIAAAVGLGGALAGALPTIRDQAAGVVERTSDNRVAVNTLPINDSGSIDAKPSRRSSPPWPGSPEWRPWTRSTT